MIQYNDGAIAHQALVEAFLRAGESAVLFKAAYDFSRHGAKGLSAYALWVHGSGVAARAFNREALELTPIGFGRRDRVPHTSSDKLPAEASNRGTLPGHCRRKPAMIGRTREKLSC